ncbi:MAG: Unknown protein [uncultured Thiotrichaceae bacterium]|uniref:SH3b domain-containing protein n=1 Tax=uncultured Thiotrichaceae bacterium TaxID=298394 RepID=A0A6S6TB36_9GAMM|nr:MAG: Unknown protein [uncultured Thiotrichaceae bacterium]
MKNLILHTLLIFGLSACNEESREITNSPDKSTVTETRYESTANQVQDDTEKPNTQAPNFRFRDSFTADSPSTEEAPTSDTTNKVTAERTSTPSTTHMAEAKPVTQATEENEAQQTANVINLPKNDTLNVRKRAGTNNTILEKLAPNDKVIVTGKSKTTKDGQQWLEIITKKKVTGWVNDHYLRLND